MKNSLQKIAEIVFAYAHTIAAIFEEICCFSKIKFTQFQVVLQRKTIYH